MAWGSWPGRGPAVVGLHGITASYMNFVGIADRLAARRFLMAFDLRGRGDSDKPDGPYGMATHAADVAGAMRALDLGPSVIVGHSMGGFVAAALAAEHPEAVAGLVLIDGGLPLEPPPGIPPEQLLDVALAAQVARLRRTFSSVEDYFAFWRELPPFAGDRWNPWVEDYLRYDLGGPGHRLQPKASEGAVRLDFLDTTYTGAIRDRLRAIEVPVLMLRAAEGFNPGDPPLYPDAVVAREASALVRFREWVVPATTHYTIALGEHGAEAAADAIVSFAEECGR
ncbi:MAG: alpha/beta fold hydrolase [Acidimicrobiales bacterium]